MRYNEGQKNGHRPDTNDSSFLRDSDHRLGAQRKTSKSGFLEDQPVEYWQPAHPLPQFAENGSEEMQLPDEQGHEMAEQDENAPTRRGLGIRNAIIKGTPVALGVVTLAYGVAAVVTGDAVYGAVSASAFLGAIGTAYEAGKDSASQPSSK